MAVACRSQPIAGNDILVSTNLREHDPFEALEDLIVEYLPTVSFGCEVDLLYPNTQEPFTDCSSKQYALSPSSAAMP